MPVLSMENILQVFRSAEAMNTAGGKLYGCFESPLRGSKIPFVWALKVWEQTLPHTLVNNCVRFCMPSFFNLSVSRCKHLLCLERVDKLLLNTVHLLCPERDIFSAFRDSQCSLFRRFYLHVFLHTQRTCFARFFLYLPIPSLFTYLNFCFFLTPLLWGSVWCRNINPREIILNQAQAPVCIHCATCSLFLHMWMCHSSLRFASVHSATLLICMLSSWADMCAGWGQRAGWAPKNTSSVDKGNTCNLQNKINEIAIHKNKQA